MHEKQDMTRSPQGVGQKKLMPPAGTSGSRMAEGDRIAAILGTQATDDNDDSHQRPMPRVRHLLRWDVVRKQANVPPEKRTVVIG
jgi:hypothetical protein